MTKTIIKKFAGITLPAVTVVAGAMMLMSSQNSLAKTEATDTQQPVQSVANQAPRATGNKNTDPLASTTPRNSVDADQQASAAQNLLSATEEADSRIDLGPITAAFDRVRAIGCPIMGSIPVLRDVAGFISIQLGIGCPTITTPAKI